MVVPAGDEFPGVVWRQGAVTGADGGAAGSRVTFHLNLDVAEQVLRRSAAAEESAKVFFQRGEALGAVLTVDGQGVRRVDLAQSLPGSRIQHRGEAGQRVAYLAFGEQCFQHVRSHDGGHQWRCDGGRGCLSASWAVGEARI